MTSFTFTIPGPPLGKERARTYHVNGVTRTVTPKKTADYEQYVKWLYKENKGPHFGTIPLLIQVEAYFKIPKSKSKKDKELMRNCELMPAKTPDADNILKAICDALNGEAYEDDKQIIISHIIKLYSDVPQVMVSIDEFRKEYLTWTSP